MLGGLAEGMSCLFGRFGFVVRGRNIAAKPTTLSRAQGVALDAAIACSFFSYPLPRLLILSYQMINGGCGTCFCRGVWAFIKNDEGDFFCFSFFSGKTSTSVEAIGQKDHLGTTSVVVVMRQHWLRGGF